MGQPPFWQAVLNTLGVIVVMTIVVRVAIGKPVPAGTTEGLLAIAGALLTGATLFRRNGRHGGNGKRQDRDGEEEERDDV